MSKTKKKQISNGLLESKQFVHCTLKILKHTSEWGLRTVLDKVRGPRRVDEWQKSHGRGCKMLVWHSQLETEGVGESSLVRGRGAFWLWRAGHSFQFNQSPEWKKTSSLCLRSQTWVSPSLTLQKPWVLACESSDHVSHMKGNVCFWLCAYVCMWVLCMYVRLCNTTDFAMFS